MRKQLLPLVQLKGIGRVRARSMYRAGLKTTEDIAKAPIHQIARAAGIGKTLARSLKEQLGVENPDTPEDYLAAEFQSQATRPASGNLKAVLSRMAENPDTTNKPTTATSSTPADDDDEREMPPKRRKPKGALDRFLSE